MALVCPSIVLSQQGSITDQGAIASLFTNSLMVAWEAHDGKMLAESFAEDADFTNVRGTSLHGRKAIAEFHTDLLSGMFKESHNRTLEIKVRFLRDDIASVDTHWEMTGAKWPDGTPWPDRKGLGSAIVEKHDGKWLIVVFHNMDLPDPHTPSKPPGKP